MNNDPDFFCPEYTGLNRRCGYVTIVGVMAIVTLVMSRVFHRREWV
jgi:Mg2+ and Co2+ transporter CorA